MIIFISFYLEGVLSKISSISFLIPLFTLISLLLIYPYIDIKKYYITCFIIGLLYDIAYTDTLLLNGIIFLLLGFLINKIYIYFIYNLLNGIVITLLLIILYRSITYLFLCFINNRSFNYSLLLKSIINSSLINIIYYIIMYKILKRKEIL